jgi:hypothetical protein
VLAQIYARRPIVDKQPPRASDIALKLMTRSFASCPLAFELLRSRRVHRYHESAVLTSKIECNLACLNALMNLGDNSLPPTKRACTLVRLDAHPAQKVLLNR